MIGDERADGFVERNGKETVRDDLATTKGGRGRGSCADRGAAARARRRANVIVALKAISPARNRFSKVLCNLASLY